MDSCQPKKKKYQFEFSIPELPPTINVIGRSHWAVKAKNARKWKDSVAHAVRHHRPREPLQRAHLTLIRYSSVRPDFDNLCSSWKNVIDSLIESEIIINDNHATIGQPDYLWEFAPRGQGKITVRIESGARG
jgi:Holliday junction resolvase RusA-like endonuclease